MITLYTTLIWHTLKLYTEKKKNQFLVPNVSAGKGFVAELQADQRVCEGSAIESVALEASSIMPALLLQRPQIQIKPAPGLTLWKRSDF